MSIKFGYIFLPFLLIAIVVNLRVGAASEQTLPTSQAINLFNVELVTRLDSKVEDGSYDTSYDFDRRLVSNVRECIDRVRMVCLDWINKKKLTLLKMEVEKHHKPYKFYLQFSEDKLSGIFEVTYRVNSNEGRAQGSFWFYNKTGSRQNLHPYSELGNLLLEAMQCSN